MLVVYLACKTAGQAAVSRRVHLLLQVSSLLLVGICLPLRLLGSFVSCIQLLLFLGSFRPQDHHLCLRYLQLLQPLGAHAWSSFMSVELDGMFTIGATRTTDLPSYPEEGGAPALCEAKKLAAQTKSAPISGRNGLHSWAAVRVFRLQWHASVRETQHVKQ
jgi:hypothetical protein